MQSIETLLNSKPVRITLQLSTTEQAREFRCGVARPTVNHLVTLDQRQPNALLQPGPHVDLPFSENRQQRQLKHRRTPIRNRKEYPPAVRGEFIEGALEYSVLNVFSACEHSFWRLVPTFLGNLGNDDTHYVCV